MGARQDPAGRAPECEAGGSPCCIRRAAGLSSGMNRVGETKTASRLRRILAFGVLAALYSWALAVMILSEPDMIGKAAFVLAWGVLNAFWLALLRRPVASAALTVTMLMVLIALSAFKHEVLFMTVSFTDVLVV